MEKKRSNSKYTVAAAAGLLIIAGLSVAIAVNNTGSSNSDNFREFAQNNLTNENSSFTYEGKKENRTDIKLSDNLEKKPEKITEEKKADNKVKSSSQGITVVPKSPVLEKKPLTTTKVKKDSEPATAEVSSSHIETVEYSFNPDKGINPPVEGKLLINYSPDHVVYHKTLNQYRTNSSLIIGCKAGTEVKSVADGKVSKIELSKVTGNTITVDLGNGYTAVYGQLEESAHREGDYIKAGEIVGKTAKSQGFYTLEGDNLYFSMAKNEENIDPRELYKK